jgi:hypothetical protein
MIAEQSNVAVANPDLEVRSCKRVQNAFLLTPATTLIPQTSKLRLNPPALSMAETVTITIIINENIKMITHNYFIILKGQPSNPKSYLIYFFHSKQNSTPFSTDVNFAIIIL